MDEACFMSADADSVRNTVVSPFWEFCP